MLKFNGWLGIINQNLIVGFIKQEKWDFLSFLFKDIMLKVIDWRKVILLHILLIKLEIIRFNARLIRKLNAMLSYLKANKNSH